MRDKYFRPGTPYWPDPDEIYRHHQRRSGYEDDDGRRSQDPRNPRISRDVDSREDREPEDWYRSGRYDFNDRRDLNNPSSTVPQYEHAGAHPSRGRGNRDRPLTSRSADPGQSSYGGFTNEDTRYQRQYDASAVGYRASDPYSWDMPDSERRQARSDYERMAWEPDRGAPSQRPRKLPKGYVRSDDRICDELCERLSYSRLDVEDVSVSVSEGTALLEGTVQDRWTKHAIENLAADSLGVKDVDNHIRVVPGFKD